MMPDANTISAWEVTQELIPKLNAVEEQIESTLKAILNTHQEPDEIERYTKFWGEFQLELMMIRMNLENLFKRYHRELEAAINDPRKDILLTLDQHETIAVENARQLHNRVQRLQQKR